MTALSVTARGRIFAQSLMVDTCTIQHPTGASTNLNNGVVTTTYTTVYTGPCKVHRSSPHGQDVGEAHLAVLEPTVCVPYTVTGVVEGDVVTINASTLDADLVGRVFRILGPDDQTYPTQRRLHCVEVTS